MIRPKALETEEPVGAWSCRGCDIWEMLRAAEIGDDRAIERLLERDPNLARAEYWYTQPIHIAVREGRRSTVELLLAAGADPEAVGLDEDLITMARDRGHRDVERVLAAAGADRAADRTGGKPSASSFGPVDLALWDGPFWNLRGDVEAVRRLVEEGADCDLVIAAALGDTEGVRARLDEDPERIAESRPSGKGALSTAVEMGHEAIVRLLLERGADPNAPEGPYAPRGVALHAAARSGDWTIVDLLLEHGADPNGYIDSSGNVAYAAKTPELRRRLVEAGARLDAYDLVWLGEDDAAVRRVAADPAAADAGCGGVLAAACKMGKRDLLLRLLAAGARVPPVLTACRSYLFEHSDMLEQLLASGMDPSLPNWQRSTPLHALCAVDGRGRAHANRLECAEILLRAGADLEARDDEYRTSPLGWAARCGLADMVEWLLGRAASPSPEGMEAWTTPLAWAARRQHGECEALLRRAGARR